MPIRQQMCDRKEGSQERRGAGVNLLGDGVKLISDFSPGGAKPGYSSTHPPSAASPSLFTEREVCNGLTEPQMLQLLSLFKCVGAICLHVSVRRSDLPACKRATCVDRFGGSQKRVVDPLEVELQMLLSLQVGAGTWSQVLFECSKHCQPRNRLFSSLLYFLTGVCERHVWHAHL